MTAEYIEGPKSGHQCSKTFINIFVFFTPDLYKWITAFAHFRIIKAKVCPRLSGFAITATFGRTFP